MNIYGCERLLFFVLRLFTSASLQPEQSSLPSQGRDREGSSLQVCLLLCFPMATSPPPSHHLYGRINCDRLLLRSFAYFVFAFLVL